MFACSDYYLIPLDCRSWNDHNNFTGSNFFKIIVNILEVGANNNIRTFSGILKIHLKDLRMICILQISIDTVRQGFLSFHRCEVWIEYCVE